MDVLFLIFGFIYTFFIPGVVVIELFFPKLPLIVKISSYIILSVLLSTYSVYFIGLIFGISRYSIIFSSLLYLPFLIYLSLRSHKKRIVSIDRKDVAPIVFGMFCFLVVFVSLYPAIFARNENYFVMSAVNWQDTAMHLGIIESIAQGNFPPQAPYYAGQPLTYYYFADFHSAIINVLYNNFFPRVLVYVNPFFVFVYSTSIYALSLYFTKSKKASLISSFLAVFSGNFMFIYFIKEIYQLFTIQGASLNTLTNLVASRGYTIEFGQLMQLPPVIDYFLQNRPMMVALPSFSIIIYLLYSGYGRKKLNRIFLAGLIVGLLTKFQFFSVLASFITYFIVALVNIRNLSFKKHVKCFLVFFLPILIFLTLIITSPVGERSFIELIKENFQFGPWDKTRSIGWHLVFVVANFNLPFLMVLALVPVLIIKRRKSLKGYLFLYLTLIVFGIIPYLVRFTIYSADMFKLFYFMLIPQSILAGYLLSRIFKKGFLAKAFVVLVLIVSSATASLTLSWSYLNKWGGYSIGEYNAGTWIRENTPQKSVFLSTPTVHSPITQVGGRLRVLSYINWPHSHGFNSGKDNVFVRAGDVESVYSESVSAEKVLKKYNVSYIYYGQAEKDKFPDAERVFENINLYELIYNREGIKIYEVVEL